jgi:hypothetical protein
MKKILQTILMLISVSTIGTFYAQSVTHNDAFFFGNIKDDYATCLTVDNQGNSITGGWYDSVTTINGTDSIASYLGVDAVLFKQDSNGNMLWSKTFGAPSVDQITAITTDDQDNIYIAVRSSGQLVLGSDTVGWAWYEDPFIAKLDPLGNFIWAKSFKSVKSHTLINSIKVANNGDIYTAGQFRDSMAVQGHKLIGDYYDGFVARFDNGGNYIALSHIEGGDYDVSRDIALTNDKGYVLSGSFKDTVNFGTTFLYNSGGSYYGYLAKYDSNMVCTWAKNLFNSTPRIDLDDNENIIANVGASVRKYNKNGTQLWSKYFAQVSEVRGIKVNNKNEIFAYGHFGTFSASTDTVVINNTQLISNGNVDFFISKLDTGGNILWSEGFGGNGYDILNGLEVYNENKVYGAGANKSATFTMGINTGTNSNILKYDGFTFNFDLTVQPSSIEVINENKSILIYPNPANNIINFSTTKTIKSVQLFNTSGVLIGEYFSKKINVSNLPKGMYISKIKTKNGIYTSRFIKQ